MNIKITLQVMLWHEIIGILTCLLLRLIRSFILVIQMIRRDKERQMKKERGTVEVTEVKKNGQRER